MRDCDRFGAISIAFRYQPAVWPVRAPVSVTLDSFQSPCFSVAPPAPFLPAVDGTTRTLS